MWSKFLTTVHNKDFFFVTCFHKRNILLIQYITAVSGLAGRFRQCFKCVTLHKIKGIIIVSECFFFWSINVDDIFVFVFTFHKVVVLCLNTVCFQQQAFYPLYRYLLSLTGAVKCRQVLVTVVTRPYTHTHTQRKSQTPVTNRTQHTGLCVTVNTEDKEDFLEFVVIHPFPVSLLWIFSSLTLTLFYFYI